MKLDSPPSQRNKDVILAVLREEDPSDGFALELSAGSGVHSVHFAAAFPGLTWQPTDIDPAALASVSARREESGLPNLLAPRRLDVTTEDWGVPAPGATLVTSINMIHISPWEASEGLFAGVGRHLAPDGVFVTYGPYLVDGAFTAPSNERFEGWLKGLDPRFGQRDLEDLRALAEGCGLRRTRLVEMPANNFCVVYRRA